MSIFVMSCDCKADRTFYFLASHILNFFHFLLTCDEIRKIIWNVNKGSRIYPRIDIGHCLEMNKTICGCEWIRLSIGTFLFLFFIFVALRVLVEV